jgi:hypothetical protein
VYKQTVVNIIICLKDLQIELEELLF